MAHTSSWTTLFWDAKELAHRVEGIAKQAQQQLTNREGVLDVWYDPDTRVATLRHIEGADTNLKVAAQVNPVLLREDEDWHIFDNNSSTCCCIFTQQVTKVALDKIAAEKSPALAGAASIMGWTPDIIDIPGWASPASATLASGLVGAGLGYGAGEIMRQLQLGGKDWDYESLPKNWAMLGGAIGAAPGAAVSASAISQGDQSLLPRDVLR